jgi:type I restriction-modification system DNA methylase subunit
MKKIKIGKEYKEIVELFNKLSGSKSMREIFNDCIEMFAIAISNSFPFGEETEKREKRYIEIFSRYTNCEKDVVFQIFDTLVNLAEENPFRDLLGELYMQLNMGSDALGQFFTPYHLAQLMAQMEIDLVEVQKLISKNGYITVLEPACGGGANVIAVCEELYRNQINYQKHCIIVCQDLSRLTALMCYVVLSLIGCSAVIKVGDTLGNPYTNYFDEIKNGAEVWTTPMFRLNNCYSKV